jgi:hypothetical protein
MQMDNDQNKSGSEVSTDQEFLRTITLLQGATKANGAINGRSTWGRSLEAIKEALRADRYETAIALVEHQIATITCLEKVLEQYILQNADRFFINGELNPLITKNLAQFQGQNRQALNLLLDLDRRKKIGVKSEGKGRDLSAISFD